MGKKRRAMHSDKFKHSRPELWALGEKRRRLTKFINPHLSHAHIVHTRNRSYAESTIRRHEEYSMYFMNYM